MVQPEITSSDEFKPIFVSNLPKIVVVPEFLTPTECDQLITLSTSRLERSMIFSEKDGRPIPNPKRTSYSMFFNRQENDLVKTIEDRLSRLVNSPIDHAEGLYVLRYQQNQEYKPHFDYFTPEAAAKFGLGYQRVATAIMYLRVPQLGGETTFPDANITFSPKQGSLLFFAYPDTTPTSLSRHGGAPVLSGEKWVATKWIHANAIEVPNGSK